MSSRPPDDREIEARNARHDKTCDTIQYVVLCTCIAGPICFLIWCVKEIIVKYLDEPSWAKVLLALIELVASSPLIVALICFWINRRTEKSLQRTGNRVESALTSQQPPAVLTAEKNGTEEGAGEPSPR